MPVPLASGALEAQRCLNKTVQPIVSLLLTDRVGPYHNFQSPGLVLMTAAVEVSVWMTRSPWHLFLNRRKSISSKRMLSYPCMDLKFTDVTKQI